MMDQDQVDEQTAAWAAESPPFRLSGLENLNPEYANWVHLTHDFYSFHVAFSRLIAPIIVNEEDRQRFIEEGWVAEAVSRLVVPAPAFREMLQIMQQQLDAYDRQFEDQTVDVPSDEETIDVDSD